MWVKLKWWVTFYDGGCVMVHKRMTHIWTMTHHSWGLICASYNWQLHNCYPSPFPIFQCWKFVREGPQQSPIQHWTRGRGIDRQNSIGCGNIFFADCLNEIQKKSSDFGFLAITREIFHGIAPNFGNRIIWHTYPDTSRCLYYCYVFQSLGTGQCKNVHVIRK